MNVLVTHAYSRENKGDAAILSVLISELRRVFDKPDITVSMMDSGKSQYFDGAKVIPSYMYLRIARHDSQLLKLLDATLMLVTTMVWAVTVRYFSRDLPIVRRADREILTAMSKADLIVPIGGGYIRTKTNKEIITLFMLLHPLLLGVLLKKKVILHSQSVGPFANRFHGWIAKKVLSRVDKIEVREDESIDQLEKIGVHRNIMRTVDAGFLFAMGVPQASKGARASMRIGVTVRQWMNKIEQDRYELEMARFVALTLVKYPAAEIVLIPQVSSAELNDDDRVVGGRIAAIVGPHDRLQVMTANYTHHEIKKVYSSLDYMIGTRFHSVIFSLTSYVPAIAIAYEHKTTGIMKDLNLSKWVVGIAEVNELILTSLFEQLIAEREDYVANLKAILPDYQRQARRAVEAMEPFVSLKRQAGERSAMHSSSSTAA